MPPSRNRPDSYKDPRFYVLNNFVKEYTSRKDMPSKVALLQYIRTVEEHVYEFRKKVRSRHILANLSDTDQKIVLDLKSIEDRRRFLRYVIRSSNIAKPDYKEEDILTILPIVQEEINIAIGPTVK